MKKNIGKTHTYISDKINRQTEYYTTNPIQTLKIHSREIYKKAK